MLYKNSLKLLSSNFSLVWKHLLYMLVSGLLTIGLVLLFAGPSVDCLKNSELSSTASNLLSTIYTEPQTIFAVIREIVYLFFSILGANFGSIWYSIIGLVIMGYLVPSYLCAIGEYNLASVSHKRMTSLLDVGYTQNMIASLRSSAGFAFVKMIARIPFDLLKLFFILLFFSFSNSFWASLLCLFFLSAILLLFHSIQTVFFSCYAPYMVEKGGNPFKGLYKSITLSFVKFEKVFSNAIILVLTCVFVNALLGIFTVFSGLLITIPATFVVGAFFSNVTYLSVKGERYYLSPSIIVNSKAGDTKPFEDRGDKANY